MSQVVDYIENAKNKISFLQKLKKSKIFYQTRAIKEQFLQGRNP
jgi:hypothetical protein